MPWSVWHLTSTESLCYKLGMWSLWRSFGKEKSNNRSRVCISSNSLDACTRSVAISIRCCDFMETILSTMYFTFRAILSAVRRDKFWVRQRHNTMQKMAAFIQTIYHCCPFLGWQATLLTSWYHHLFTQTFTGDLTDRRVGACCMIMLWKYQPYSQSCWQWPFSDAAELMYLRSIAMIGMYKHDRGLNIWLWSCPGVTLVGCG